jgi:DNA polymerase-3 subunit chi
VARALFYHVTRSAPEATLALLVGRAMGQGWRVMIRGTDEARLRWFDDWLWREPEDGFLPHGMQGSPDDARQPVLLGTGPVGNAAQGLLLIDGAGTTAEEAAALERVWVLFDGADAAAVAGARGLWKRLTDGGVAAQYWSEKTGKWAMEAEKGG